MPRPARNAVGGICYHCLNRGNNGAEIFHKQEDYQALIGLMADCCERIEMRVLDYTLMPNHFHFVLWPLRDGDLSRWMHWLMTTHAARYHKHYGTHGHLWGDRFKAFPIEEDGHLLTVLRYVERNPARARLVRRAEGWRWSALGARHAKQAPEFLAPWPVSPPDHWLSLVNETESQALLNQVRGSVNRNIPFGSDSWVRAIADRLGLPASARPPGRPRQ